MNTWQMFALLQLLSVGMWLLMNFVVLSIGWPVTDDWYWYDEAGEAFSIAMLWLCVGCGFWISMDIITDRTGEDL